MKVTVNKVHLLILGLAVLSFACVTLYINAAYFKYPGNNYLPGDFLQAIILSSLVFCGLNLVLSKDSLWLEVNKYLIYLLILYSLIALAVNGIQYTPFNPIDLNIIHLENYFHVDLASILAWTQSYPAFLGLLKYAYNSLVLQLVVFPLFILAFKKFELFEEYCFLQLSAVLIGFIFYYFYPTIAPASFIDSPYFMNEQIATGLKFQEIHNHIIPSTSDGGLISLPSFHVIWAIYMIYILKPWPLLFWVILPFNSILIVSCVLLGWHYPSDLLGSLVVVGISFALLRCSSGSQPKFINR